MGGRIRKKKEEKLGRIGGRIKKNIKKNGMNN